ncbi:MAG TPA: biotin transporter BioY [Thermodesulfobacteriota bacterium]
MATSPVDLLGTRPPLTLADVACPKAGALRDALLVAGFIGVNALFAQVAIPLPFTPVPITGQTFAVRLTGGILGARLGLIALLGYLVAGAVGLPVFQPGGAAGAERFLGPTAGYLVGFAVSAWLMGRLAEAGWDRRFGRGIAAMLLASLPIYALGLIGLWLWQPMPLGTLLAKGLWPFLPGDVLKLVLAAGLLASGWRLVERLKRV